MCLLSVTGSQTYIRYLDKELGSPVNRYTTMARVAVRGLSYRPDPPLPSPGSEVDVAAQVRVWRACACARDRARSRRLIWHVARVACARSSVVFALRFVCSSSHCTTTARRSRWR
jgi:hypothetical protein